MLRTTPPRTSKYVPLLSHFPTAAELKNSANNKGGAIGHASVVHQLDTISIRHLVQTLAGVARHRFDPEEVVREALGYTARHKQHLYLRFPEHRDRSSGECFFSCGVILPFYFLDPTLKHTRADDPGRHSDHLVVFPSVNFELFDARKEAGNFVDGGRRYFRLRDEARQFALLYFVMAFKGMCGVHHSARALYQPTEVPDSKPTRQIKSFSTYFRAGTANKGMMPFLVSIQYRDVKDLEGGLCYYLVNNEGARISGKHLSRPSPLCGRHPNSSGYGEVSSIIGIRNHRGPLSNKDSRYFGCSFNLNVCWSNGLLEEVPVSIVRKTAPEMVQEYSVLHNLSTTAPFKGINKHGKIPEWNPFRILPGPPGVKKGSYSGKTRASPIDSSGGVVRSHPGWRMGSCAEPGMIERCSGPKGILPYESGPVGHMVEEKTDLGSSPHGSEPVSCTPTEGASLLDLSCLPVREAYHAALVHPHKNASLVAEPCCTGGHGVCHPRDLAGFHQEGTHAMEWYKTGSESMPPSQTETKEGWESWDDDYINTLLMASDASLESFSNLLGESGDDDPCEIGCESMDPPRTEMKEGRRVCGEDADCRPRCGAMGQEHPSADAPASVAQMPAPVIHINTLPMTADAGLRGISNLLEEFGDDGPCDIRCGSKEGVGLRDQKACWVPPSGAMREEHPNANPLADVASIPTPIVHANALPVTSDSGPEVLSNIPEEPGDDAVDESRWLMDLFEDDPKIPPLHPPQSPTRTMNGSGIARRDGRDMLPAVIWKQDPIPVVHANTFPVKSDAGAMHDWKIDESRFLMDLFEDDPEIPPHHLQQPPIRVAIGSGIARRTAEGTWHDGDDMLPAVIRKQDPTKTKGETQLDDWDVL